ncbi:MAG: mechanosensitive ion channel family protein [Bryobacteraceae bacterium]|nr:mechanosensitive ion channel family protein [Bryobacteraceae bacterium]
MTPAQLASWTLPVTVFSVSTLIALLVRQVVLRVLASRVPASSKAWRLFLETVRGPSVLWCLAAGLAIAIHNAQAPRTFEYWAQKSIGVFTIVSIGLVGAAVAVRMVAVYGERKSLRIAGLSKTLVYLVIFSIVLLMVLSEFEVQITPILTALGVGGLAVALALQDTLSNFFAGIHILVEEPIRVGDFVRLSKDEEGTVSDIGWRTTRIQTFQNTVIVVPNKNLVSANIVNFHLAERRVSTEIDIYSANEASPDQIAELAMAIAERTEGVLPEPAPIVLLDPGVLHTHMQMKLVVHVATVAERAPVRSDIRAQLHRAFREHGIPFPVVKV